MSSSVGQFIYWKFNIFLALENQLSRSFAGSLGHSCDEEEWPQNSSQNLHKYPWCTTLLYSHEHICSFFIELNTLASDTMTSEALEDNCPNQSESDCESLLTLPLFALFTCCWMSFEAVLGNTEFEFAVLAFRFWTY